jgi:hypothetical protein
VTGFDWLGGCDGGWQFSYGHKEAQEGTKVMASESRELTRMGKGEEAHLHW